MHILLTNDDGPPSAESSPYILPFVHALESHNHSVSVCIPSSQKSWIGKAHFPGGGQITTKHYWPEKPTSSSSSQQQPQPWILVDSSPAACTQLALGHFFPPSKTDPAKGPIDLVISGPNYGRNSTAVFALSSGTLGAALEATTCGHRAIALSFAFFDRKNVPAVIEESCEHAVRVCERLASEEKLWEGEGRLFSVNVPLQAGVSGRRAVWTRMLGNSWREAGSLYQETTGSATDDEGGEVEEEGERTFKWAPKFGDVFTSVREAGPGFDGWVITQGETSVTALEANFTGVEGLVGGELVLTSKAPLEGKGEARM